MNPIDNINSDKSIFVASFDDRFLIPDYIKYFISYNLEFCDLNFISPKNNINLKKNVKCKSNFKLRIINPNNINGYRDAPPGLRLWTGATVQNQDIICLLPWLDWAYNDIKSDFNQLA